MHLRFGVEAPVGVRGKEGAWKPMPKGWYFGRVSMVANDLQSNVYVLHRNGDIDPLVVFDAEGNYLRSWGKGVIDDPHGVRVDRREPRLGGGSRRRDSEVHDRRQAPDDDRHQGCPRQRRQVIRQPDGSSTGIRRATSTSPTGTATAASRSSTRAASTSCRGARPAAGPSQFRTVHSIQFDSKDRAYVSDRENNRIQIFDTNGKLLKTWNHLGSTQGIWISPKDEMYVLTHRNNVENITADTLAGRLMKIDLESGKVLGSMESPGHSVNGSPNGDIFVAQSHRERAALDAAPGIHALSLTQKRVDSSGADGRGQADEA